MQIHSRPRVGLTLTLIAMTLLIPSLALAKSWAQVKRDIRERPSAGTTVTPDGEWSETTEFRNGHEVVVGQFPYIVTPLASDYPATFTVVDQSRSDDGQETVSFASNNPEIMGRCGAVRLRNTYIPNVLLVPAAHP